MLVLTRRTGEAIFIGKEVQICVLGVKGSQVRLGVAAPTRISVDREEVYRRKQQELSAIEEPPETDTDAPP